MYGKKNSLPFYLNMITTPTNIFGDWKGDSIFRINLEDRGNDNLLKKKYMIALTKEKIFSYENIITNYLTTKLVRSSRDNLFHLSYTIVLDITFLLHFGFLPNRDDKQDLLIFINALTNSYKDFRTNYEIDLQLYNLEFFYIKILNYFNRVKRNKVPCIIYYWLEEGYITDSNIFVELFIILWVCVLIGR